MRRRCGFVCAGDLTEHDISGEIHELECGRDVIALAFDDPSEHVAALTVDGDA